MKIVFMGTPQFAVPILEEISKQHQLVLIVTQPDQYNSRRKEIIFSPVKQWAVDNKHPVFQPLKIRKDYQKILDLEVDLIITAAYGQIVGEEVLNHPQYKAINIHGSLLPKYRGGAPIQRALMNGEKQTGITIMYMAKKMDAGDILKMQAIDILASDNQDTLFTKLSDLAASMINEVIFALERQTIFAIAQNEAEVTYAYNLSKKDEEINFNVTARQVFNQIRGLSSNPGGYFVIDNQIIKVYNSIVSSRTHASEAGRIIAIDKNSFDISCAEGTSVSILELQLPSKSRMMARDFVNGQGRKMLQINKKIGEQL
ncbi:MAG TPA: methionyl-tRNA formyltransferase [Bacilli bacterium]|nr:methionyl-tRNA formyltransferase [Bacilli bacterium]